MVGRIRMLGLGRPRLGGWRWLLWMEVNIMVWYDGGEFGGDVLEEER